MKSGILYETNKFNIFYETKKFDILYKTKNPAFGMKRETLHCELNFKNPIFCMKQEIRQSILKSGKSSLLDRSGIVQDQFNYPRM